MFLFKILGIKDIMKLIQSGQVLLPEIYSSPSLEEAF